MNKNSVCGIFAVAVFIVVFLVFNNIWLSVIAFVFALFLAMALRPNFAVLFDKRDAKVASQLPVLRERGMENGVPDYRVLFGLIVTQDVEMNVTSKKQKEILDNLFEQSVAYFNENFEFFQRRYADLQAKELPMKILCGTCDDKKSSLKKCYRTWQKITRTDNLIPPRENVDLFFHDQQFTDHKGNVRNAVTALQFYRW